MDTLCVCIFSAVDAGWNEFRDDEGSYSTDTFLWHLSWSFQDPSMLTMKVCTCRGSTS